MHTVETGGIHIEDENGTLNGKIKPRTRGDGYAVPSLVSVLLFSIILHLLPVTFKGFFIWGSDSGEYYNIINSILQKGRVPVDYQGWGFAYPFFYGMEALAAALSLLTGIDGLTVMVLIIPSLTAFLVLPIFFIAKKVFQDVRVALIASLFVAVSPSGVFATSHPMPGALGDLLGLLVLYFYLELRPGAKGAWIALLLSISALMVTHHMSAYFVFITLGFYTLLRETLKRTHPHELRQDSLVLYFFLVFMTLYWLVFVEPFRDRIVNDAFGVSGWYIMAGAVLALTVILYLLRMRRNFHWYYHPTYPDMNRIMKMLLIVGGVAALIMVGIAFTGVPGTSIQVKNSFLLLVIPLLIMVILAAPAPGFVRFYSRGLFIYAWLGSITISMVAMTALNSTVLLPYRHTQYLLEPLLILSALGFVELYRYLPSGKRFSRQFAAGLCVVLLSLGVGHSAYPPREVIGNFQEGTVYPEMEGVYWVREYAGDFSGGGEGKIASDHRMSSLLFGVGGVDATWDSANHTLHSRDYSNCSEEIARLNITGVFMDREIEKGAAMLQWENAEPISQASIAKFESPPFIRVLDTGFVQVYYVGNTTRAH